MRKVLAAISLVCLGGSLAWAQSPCDGKITDKLNHPMNAGAVAKPTAGGSYVDPAFGTLITRISNAQPAEGTNAVIKTTYSTMRGWNADESLIIAWHRGGRYELYDGDKPYTHRKTISFTTYGPSDLEQVIWDATNPLVFYFPAMYNAEPKFFKHTINLSGADTTTLYRDFGTAPTNCATAWTSVLTLGSDPHAQTTGPRQIIGLACGTRKILYSITENSVIATVDAPAEGTVLAPWALPNESGAFFSTWADKCPPLVTNLSFSTVLTLPSVLHCREHQALGATPGGYNTFNSVAFDDQPYGTLISRRLDTGAARTIIGMENGWPYPLSGTHVSLTARSNPGWLAVSSLGTRTGATLLDQELVLANTETGEVCRIAHVRSDSGENGPWGYWGEPHPQISKDGYRVLFSSDWLGSSTVDLYVADLRPQAVTIITAALANAVKGEPYDQPLSIVGGVGAPYSCGMASGTLPAGLILVGCQKIGGTATELTTKVVGIRACDAASECTIRGYSLTSQDRPVISTASPLQQAIVGSPYSACFDAALGVQPYSWSKLSGEFCAGLALSGRCVSGTPITLQTCDFQMQATDSHAQPISGSKPFSLTVALGGQGCPCAPGPLTVEVKP